MENKFSMVAKTFQGLEDVLRDELISLGAENVEMGRRMVSFEGDLEMMYKANLCCRTALRILKPIEKFTAHDPDELYDIVREIDWRKYMTPDTTFAIDSTVNSEDFTHSRFVTYRVKDGIVDHFNDTEGRRPSICVAGADLLFNVHIDHDRVTISLDSSGEPLSRRGYRQEQTEAPLNEVLAAGIIMKTGWRGDCDFADPMCGSGTFLVEAALIASNINPGIFRQSFAFEKWPDFDKDLFEELYNDDSGEREFAFRIYGGDIDPDAVAIARRNIKAAQVDNMVELTCRPMADWTENPDNGVLVMNPPYGRRLRPDDMVELFRGIGTCLKQNFKGWNAWIIGPDNDDFSNIGLKPSLKIPLLNGSIECSLREFVLFDGAYNDFRAAGGKVNFYEEEEEENRRPRKMKRISDDEWRGETKKFGGHQKERRYDKKKTFRRDERPESRSYGPRDDRRDFKPREERRSYGPREERHDFKPGGEKRSYGPREERRDFKPRGERREDDRGNRREYERRDDRRGSGRDARIVKPQGPKISADKEHIISPVHFRSRKKNYSDSED